MLRLARALLPLCLLACAAADGLRVAWVDQPPYFYLDGGKIDGIVVAVFDALNQIDPELGIAMGDPLPSVRRAEEELSNGGREISFGVISEARRQRYVLLDPPLVRGRFRVLSRAGESERIDSMAALARASEREPVLVTSGVPVEQLLAATPGLHLDAAPMQAPGQIRKLLAGHGRHLVLHEPIARYAAYHLGVSEQLRFQPLIVAEYAATLAASPRLEPDRAERLAAAWRKLAASPKLQSILTQPRHNGAAIAEIR
ncbi:hypothetical protein [Chitinimonas koreensis]|uniref:hypothetical protein n=1 Tax=Chitinimonas koreensis TaxID=356302 RepID=UPI0003FFD942|nr:hypothetical protein [Chitinimonas koreensis]QNM96620.1 hypothetical protein H9L41_23170 [Chitinimonas koreensis]